MKYMKMTGNIPTWKTWLTFMSTNFMMGLSIRKETSNENYLCGIGTGAFLWVLRRPNKSVGEHSRGESQGVFPCGWLRRKSRWRREGLRRIYAGWPEGLCLSIESVIWGRRAFKTSALNTKYLSDFNGGSSLTHRRMTNMCKRTQGTVQTDDRSKTTWRDASGRIQGTATTDRNGKTTYRDGSGRLIGTRKVE